MILPSIIYLILYYSGHHIYVALHAWYLNILPNYFHAYIIKNFLGHCRLIWITVTFRKSKFDFWLIVAETRNTIKNHWDKEEIHGNSSSLTIMKIILKKIWITISNWPLKGLTLPHVNWDLVNFGFLWQKCLLWDKATF